MANRTSSWTLIALLSLTVSFSAPALANGGNAKNSVLEGETWIPESGSVRFVIDTNPVVFYLGTVNLKYHVLLIRAINDNEQALPLSIEQDRIELRFGPGEDVTGIIDLRSVDPETWDGLEAEMREAVAYPPNVPAGEEEGIYVFVPVDAVAEARREHAMPDIIIYEVESADGPAVIGDRSLVAE